LNGDIAKAFGFGLKNLADPGLLAGGQRAIADLVRADLESANA